VAESANEEPEGPTSTLEAIEAALEGEEGAAGADPEKVDDAAAESGDAVADATADPEAKADGEKDGAPEGDDLLTPPEGISDDAKSRFEKLSTGYRELAAERDQVVTDHEALRSTILETGVNAEEFQVGLNYMRYAHSSDPADLERALEIIEAERTAIAQRLGRPIEGVDLLAHHQDLKEAIEAMDISPERAQELASLRDQAARAQQESARRTAAEAVTDETTRTIEGVRQSLNDMDAGWRSSDVNYARKMQVLSPKIETIIAANADRLHMVPALVQQEWKAIGDLITALEGDKHRGGSGHQALSGGTGRGTAPPEPASTLDAINQALGHT